MFHNPDDEIVYEASVNPDEHVLRVVKGVRGPYVQNRVMTCRDYLPEGWVWDVMRMAFPIHGKYNGHHYGTSCTQRTTDRITFLFFRRGIINLVGGKCEASNAEILHAQLRRLRKEVGFEMVVHDLSTKNILATLYMDYTINLFAIKEELATSRWEPDNIKHLKYTVRLRSGGSVTWLIYPAGSCVMCKATSEEQLVEARDIFTPFLGRFAQNPVTDEDRRRAEAHAKHGVKKALQEEVVGEEEEEGEEEVLYL